MSKNDAASESAPAAKPAGMAAVQNTTSPDTEFGGEPSSTLPRSWKYRQYEIFGHTLPWYASPRIQLGLVAFVCFMCPGMFNALGGMGGGGKTDPTLADNMVSATLRLLYG